MIKSRNETFAAKFQRNLRSNAEQLKSARKKLKSAITVAKNKWILKQCEQLNDAVSGGKGTKSPWGIVAVL